MVSSNCNFNRAGMRGSGSRGADLSAFSGLPALALSPFPGLSLWAGRAARSALSALSGLPSSASRGDRPCSGVFSGRLACFSSVSAIDLDSRTLGKAHLSPVGQNLETHARRLAVLGVGDRQI
jgi:hypothetical protein